LAAVVCLAACLGTSGCFFGKKKPLKVFTPPPVIAKTPPPQEDLDVNSLPAPVDLSTPVDSGMPPVKVGNTLPPAPPKPPAPKPPAPKPAPVVVEPPSPPPVVAPPPKPSTILSAQDRNRLLQDLNTRLDRARKALDRVAGRNLSPELAELAATARSYITQAEQERAGDLPTAVSLATRAERFATDLLARLP
jgi:hypothetical protein